MRGGRAVVLLMALALSACRAEGRAGRLPEVDASAHAGRVPEAGARAARVPEASGHADSLPLPEVSGARPEAAQHLPEVGGRP